LHESARLALGIYAQQPCMARFGRKSPAGEGRNIARRHAVSVRLSHGTQALFFSFMQAV
jgi:hypothetical protein